ncbi:MAG: hypothetical protein SGI84_02810 [Gemmatimonadota bacterium]|nr:hypothetical protein [Gemmatimonadota bacterium]
MAIAGIAATLIGFASVVFAVGRASASGLSVPERNALGHLLIPASCVLFLAFVPVVAAVGFAAQPQIWRASNGLQGIIHLTLIVNAARAAARSQILEPLPVRLILIPGGFLALAANFAVALGFMQHYAAMIYIAGLVWFLLVAAVQFVMLIFLHARAS